MKMSFGAKSLALFALSVLFLVLLTLFESSFSGMSLTAERVISSLLLVLPGVIGIVLGVLSMLRREPRVWGAILGLIFNTFLYYFKLPSSFLRAKLNHYFVTKSLTSNIPEFPLAFVKYQLGRLCPSM